MGAHKSQVSHWRKQLRRDLLERRAASLTVWSGSDTLSYLPFRVCVDQESGGPNGGREITEAQRRFFRVVQPTGIEGATCRLRASARLHDRAPLWLGAVGKYSTVA